MNPTAEEEAPLLDIQRTPEGDLKVTINPPSSTEAVRLIHQLTNDGPKKEESPDYQGAFAGFTWSRPEINGEKSEMSLEGIRPDGAKVFLVIRQMAAGFVGSGSIDAVAILVHLGLGEYDYLFRVVTSKPRDLPDHLGWTVKLPASVLTPHLP